MSLEEIVEAAADVVEELATHVQGDAALFGTHPLLASDLALRCRRLLNCLGAARRAVQGLVLPSHGLWDKDVAAVWVHPVTHDRITWSTGNVLSLWPAVDGGPSTKQVLADPCSLLEARILVEARGYRSRPCSC